MALRIGFLVSHPIQYYAPIFRELADHCDLTVFYAHQQTAEQQARSGFGVAFDWDVDLLAGYHSKFLRNVARAPSTDRFFGCDTPDIAGEIAGSAFDAFIVPGWALCSYWQAVRACRRAGVPVLVRGDSQLLGRRSGAIRLAKTLGFRSVLRRFDGFLYVGRLNRDYLLHYGARPDRLFFSPHCVDNGAFRQRSDAARQQLGSTVHDPSRARRILFVGKLVDGKRPLDVLQAALQVRARGVDVEVAFAGSGELQGTLEAAAAAAGLRVHLHGFVNQSKMPALYASADVIVVPSAGETWGLVVNEAMACGIPAVVSDAVGCGPDLIEQGATGAIFPLGNITAMASGIQEVLAFDPKRTQRALSERMETYSPERAAQGIAVAADILKHPSR